MEKDCVFCDRTKLQERLIHESEDFYVVATLGQITDGGYVLLIPKEHVSCMGALTPDRTINMFELRKEIYRALSLEYCQNIQAVSYPVTIFEHGIVGQTIQHAHTHFMPFMPVAVDFTPRIHTDFPIAEFEELHQYAAHLHKLYQMRREPYLLWTTPRGKFMVCWNPPAPPQYLRTVAAELLGRPERGNWRNMDAELDKRLCAETVARLKPYFL